MHQRAYAPAWSPDGEHIVFSAPGLFVMNPDGTGATTLPTEHVAKPRCPTGPSEAAPPVASSALGGLGRRLRCNPSPAQRDDPLLGARTGGS